MAQHAGMQQCCHYQLRPPQRIGGGNDVITPESSQDGEVTRAEISSACMTMPDLGPCIIQLGGTFTYLVSDMHRRTLAVNWGCCMNAGQRAYRRKSVDGFLVGS